MYMCITLTHTYPELCLCIYLYPHLHIYTIKLLELEKKSNLQTEMLTKYQIGRKIKIPTY
jgi:hypothetical protein